MDDGGLDVDALRGTSVEIGAIRGVSLEGAAGGGLVAGALVDAGSPDIESTILRACSIT